MFLIMIWFLKCHALNSVENRKYKVNTYFWSLHICIFAFLHFLLFCIFAFLHFCISPFPFSVSFSGANYFYLFFFYFFLLNYLFMKKNPVSHSLKSPELIVVCGAHSLRSPELIVVCGAHSLKSPELIVVCGAGFLHDRQVCWRGYTVQRLRSKSFRKLSQGKFFSLVYIYITKCDVHVCILY